MSRHTPMVGAQAISGLVGPAASIVVIVLVAVGIVAAIAAAATARADAAWSTAARADVVDDADQIAAVGYRLLADGGGWWPAPCSDAPWRTCTTVRGIDATTDWAVTPADRRRLDGLPVTITIVGTLTPPVDTGLPIVEVSRQVLPPPLPAEAATVTATLLGPPALIANQPIRLVDTAGRPQTSAVTTDPTGTAVLYLPDGARCAAGCRIGVGTDDRWWATDTISLDTASAVGPALTVTRPGEATWATATVRETGSVTINVVADIDGTAATGAPEGSVCLWAAATVDDAQLLLPGCNSPDPQTITFEQFLPDRSRGDVRLPLPAGADLQILADRPDGLCPQITDQLPAAPASDGTFSAQAVCTSWTWGRPAQFGPAGAAGPVAGTSLGTVTSSTDVVVHDAIWTDPATTIQGPWAAPRTPQGCARAASCDAADSPDAACPPDQPLCLAAATPPRLASPSPLVVAPAPGQTVDVPIRAAGAGLTVTVVDAAPTGLLTLATPSTPPVSAIADVTVPLPDGGGTIQLGATGAIVAGQITLELTDSVGTTTATIRLVADPAAALTATQTGGQPTVAQGDTTSAAVRITDGTGLPAAGNVTVPDPGPLQQITAQPAEPGGIVPVSITAGAAPAGVHTVDVEVNGQPAGTLTVIVTQTAGALTVTDTAVAQGAAGQLVITATDLTGDPYPGVQVTGQAAARPSAAGGPAVADVTVAPSCRTGQDGTCALDIAVAPTAQLGAVAVAVGSGTTTTTGTVTVVAADGTITVTVDSRGPLPGQGPGEVTLLVHRDGQPAAGLPLTLTVPAGATIAADGRCETDPGDTCATATSRPLPPPDVDGQPLPPDPDRTGVTTTVSRPAHDVPVVITVTLPDQTTIEVTV